MKILRSRVGSFFCCPCTCLLFDSVHSSLFSFSKSIEFIYFVTSLVYLLIKSHMLIDQSLFVSRPTLILKASPSLSILLHLYITCLRCEMYDSESKQCHKPPDQLYAEVNPYNKHELILPYIPLRGITTLFQLELRQSLMTQIYAKVRDIHQRLRIAWMKRRCTAIQKINGRNFERSELSKSHFGSW